MIRNNNNEIVSTSNQDGIVIQDDKGGAVDFFYEKSVEADRVLNSVTEVLMDVRTVKESFQVKKEEYQYVVEFSEDVKKALSRKEIKLDCSKKGEIYAQIRKKDGKLSSKLPIKQQLVEKGIDPSEVASALRTKTISEELKSIASTLDEIGYSVSEVVKGQENDRMALYFSSLGLYREASKIQDNSLRRQIMTNALCDASTAISQMSQELQMNIKYLRDKSYKLGKKQEATKRIDEKMNSIYRAFDNIYHAVILKMAIYYDLNEIEALLATAKEYGHFIETRIVPNVLMLSEHDRNDVYLTNGVWEQRVRSLKIIDDIVCNLENKQTVYCLRMEGQNGQEKKRMSK